MTGQVTLQSEGLTTFLYRTLQSFVIAMDPLVLLQPRPIYKLVATNITEMSFDAVMRLDVPGQVILLAELFIALLTWKLFIQLSRLV